MAYPQSVSSSTPASSPAPPLITVTLALEPPNFSPGDKVELSVTATSHASTPIMIYTWPHIFNLNISLGRRHGLHFTCLDLTTDTPLDMRPWKTSCTRHSQGHKLDRDGNDYLTLYPEQTIKLSTQFGLALETITSENVRSNRMLRYGHRYRLGVQEDEKIGWWRTGTKEENLPEPGEHLKQREKRLSGMPIALHSIAPECLTSSLKATANVAA